MGGEGCRDALNPELDGRVEVVAREDGDGLDIFDLVVRNGRHVNEDWWLLGVVK